MSLVYTLLVVVALLLLLLHDRIGATTKATASSPAESNGINAWAPPVVDDWLPTSATATTATARATNHYHCPSSTVWVGDPELCHPMMNGSTSPVLLLQSQVSPHYSHTNGAALERKNMKTNMFILLKDWGVFPLAHTGGEVVFSQEGATHSSAQGGKAAAFATEENKPQEPWSVQDLMAQPQAVVAPQSPSSSM